MLTEFVYLLLLMHFVQCLMEATGYVSTGFKHSLSLWPPLLIFLEIIRKARRQIYIFESLFMVVLNTNAGEGCSRCRDPKY